MPVGHRVDGTKCFLFAFRIIFWTASKYILGLSKNRQWRWKPEAKIIKLQRLKKVSDFNLYFSMLNSPIRQCNFFQKHLNKNNKNNNIKHARKKKNGQIECLERIILDIIDRHGLTSTTVHKGNISSHKKSDCGGVLCAGFILLRCLTEPASARGWFTCHTRGTYLDVARWR